MLRHKTAAIVFIALAWFMLTTASAQTVGYSFADREQLVAGLQALVGTCDADGNNYVGKAVEHLNSSLGVDRWADPGIDALHPSNGFNAFDDDADAVNDLLDAVAKSTTCADEPAAAITFLVEADRILAQAAIDRSGVFCTTADCVDYLERASTNMAEAQAELDKDDPKNAITKYRDAWKDALDAGRRRDKMTICHIPPGNPAARRTITISSRSIDTHQNKHGDHFGDCGFEGQGSVDMGLATEADDPMAPSGSRIRHRVRVRNEGPDDATNMAVQVDWTPGDVFALGAADVDGEFDLTTGRWTIPYIESATEAVLELDGTAQEEFTHVRARVVQSDQEDGNPANDDTEAAAFSLAASTSGSEGGLESNGSLAARIALRQFRRRKAAQEGRVAPALPLFRFAGKTSGLDVYLPTEARYGASAYRSTPDDLVGVTNATDAAAVDYLLPDGTRLGALLLLETPAGQVYEHSKVICDRLVGAELVGARTVRVNGFDFVMTELRHPGGAVDYAISFALYPSAGTTGIESRFRNADYRPDPLAGRVLNFQVWSAWPIATLGLVGTIIERAGAESALKPIGPPASVPTVRVRAAELVDGHVELTLDNRSDATRLTLRGVRHATEQAASAPFETVIDVEPHAESRLRLAPGLVYDLGFTLDPGDGGTIDETYVADGAWGAVAGDAGTIDRFEVFPADAWAEGVIPRPVSMAGHSRTWTAVFRFLRAGGRSRDLGAVRTLTVRGTAQGRWRLVFESTASGRPVPVSTPLYWSSDGSVVVDLESLRGGEAGGDWRRAVTQITFLQEGNGLNEEPVALTIDDLRLSGDAATTVNTVPEALPEHAFSVGAPYPNPFMDHVVIPIRRPDVGTVTADIFDLLGRRVHRTVTPPMAAGPTEIRLATSHLPAGTYLVRVSAGRHRLTTSIVRMR